MKKYILGNYELSFTDIVLLKECILNRLEDNEDYIRFSKIKKLNEFYEIENKHLELIVEQLKGYGD